MDGSESFEEGTKLEDIENKPLEEKRMENADLWKQFTKRNEQYMMGLDKILSQANYDEERKQKKYHQIMSELVVSQKTGTTARQLYGTVSECADAVLKQKDEAPARSSDFLLAVDGGLLLGSIFALISGVTLLTSKQPDTLGMGIISLIMNYVVGGIAMLIISKYTPDPNAPKGKKGYGKYILATTLAMLLWMMTMTLTTGLIPLSINIPLPPVAYIVIGVIGFAAKIFLKKRYQITGSIF